MLDARCSMLDADTIRSPRTYEGETRMEKSSLTVLAPQQLTLARTASSGPSSQTVYGAQDHTPRHTGPADRRTDRPSGEIGEAAEHALQVGTVSIPGTRGPA
jgi:hypothetical protein